MVMNEISKYCKTLTYEDFKEYWDKYTDNEAQEILDVDDTDMDLDEKVNYEFDSDLTLIYKNEDDEEDICIYINDNTSEVIIANYLDDSDSVYCISYTLKEWHKYIEEMKKDNNNNDKENTNV